VHPANPGLDRRVARRPRRCKMQGRVSRRDRDDRAPGEILVTLRPARLRPMDAERRAKPRLVSYPMRSRDHQHGPQYHQPSAPFSHQGSHQQNQQRRGINPSGRLRRQRESQRRSDRRPPARPGRCCTQDQPGEHRQPSRHHKVVLRAARLQTGHRQRRKSPRRKPLPGTPGPALARKQARRDHPKTVGEPLRQRRPAISAGEQHRLRLGHLRPRRHHQRAGIARVEMRHPSLLQPDQLPRQVVAQDVRRIGRGAKGRDQGEPQQRHQPGRHRSHRQPTDVRRSRPNRPAHATPHANAQPRCNHEPERQRRAKPQG